jgi:hypothetical protein
MDHQPRPFGHRAIFAKHEDGGRHACSEGFVDGIQPASAFAQSGKDARAGEDRASRRRDPKCKAFLCGNLVDLLNEDARGCVCDFADKSKGGGFGHIMNAL